MTGERLGERDIRRGLASDQERLPPTPSDNVPEGDGLVAVEYRVLRRHISLLFAGVGIDLTSER